MAVRAVLDTNIWVSSLLNPVGFPARLRRAFAAGEFQVIVSEPLLAELADVLNRPRIKIKYGLSEDDIIELLTLIEERAEHVFLSASVAVCRDADDDAVIETAINGGAQFIISRDDDLKFDPAVTDFLALHSISIVTIAKFLAILQNR